MSSTKNFISGFKKIADGANPAATAIMGGFNSSTGMSGLAKSLSNIKKNLGFGTPTPPPAAPKNVSLGSG